MVGGGAAGLVAAGAAAQAGADVLVLERMTRPARKLRISGKGRGNLTNMAPIEEFIEHFGPNGRFLRQAFGRFFSEDLIELVNSLGVPTKVERGGRVFPVSDRAQDVVDALVDWARRSGAKIETGARVSGLVLDDASLAGVAVGAHLDRTERCDAVIVATGGASYRATGSSGDGYRLAESAGHTIVPIRPALVPLETEGRTAQALQGLALRNAGVRVLVDGDVALELFGELLFTHFGVSGPTVLTASRTAVDALELGRRVEISIDLKPALDERKLDARLLRDLDAHGSRFYESILKDLLPRKLIPVAIERTRIPRDRKAGRLSSEERARLRSWLKDFRLTVTGHRGFDEAIVTAGGVDTSEIDPRTMQSRLAPGLYFAGEVIDVDGDTGGYNLQAAFSTGWLAGSAAGGDL